MASRSGSPKPRKRDKFMQAIGLDRFSRRSASPSPRGSKNKTRNKLFEGVKTALETVVTVADAFPPLKSTAAGLLVLLKAIDDYGENRKEFTRLSERLKVLSEIMVSFPAEFPDEVGDRFSGLASIVEESQKILEERLDPKRSKIERFILSPRDKEEVLKITQEISFAIEIAMSWKESVG
ncbi:hypothetical protein DFP72DRAFT_846710 [Ephemerocybe angulata]|uniref:Uncharacterized protein n=1 Tax=Ephemerocybe angulata TaxID=980116 RepID=A0A8H6I1W0_9AGAR|nr:hypothetical protein DFP72DRAFT_846710 [Tulosesus angulatus]